MKTTKKKAAYPRFSLFNIKTVERAFKARPFQFIVQFPVVLLFILVVITGLYGVMDPGRNFSTVATWTTWWIGIIFVIPFLGAGWCLICPWSAISDWMERVSLWNKKEGVSLGIKWPVALRNRYPAIIFFIIVTWLELGILITYNPLYTAYLAFLMLFLTAITALVFEKKAFCRYVCFVGGIIGIYSNLASVEVRSKSRAVCDGCKTMDCVKGNEKGYGCPVFEYPGGMNNNSNCIVCSECFKTCPHDNMSLNLRPLFADVSKGYAGRYDEAILVLALLALSVYHGFTMLPVWTGWAVKTMGGDYYLYMSLFTLLEMVFIAGAIGLHYLVSYFIKLVSKRRDISLRNIFIGYSYAILPVAFFYHLSHNAGHFGMEGMEIVPVLSDPFGWGWDIFGTAGVRGGMIMDLASQKVLQMSIIGAGFAASVYLSYTTSVRLFGASGNIVSVMVPPVTAIAGYTVMNIWITLQPMAMRTISLM